MIYPTDVLYADIMDGAIMGTVKNTSEYAVTLVPTASETSASITVNAGATVNVPVGTYMNGTTKVKVEKGKTTNVQGTAPQ